MKIDGAFEIVNRALRELEAVRNVSPPLPFGELPWPISVGIIHAGDWASTVPDQLVAEGRYGVMPGEAFTDAQHAFERAVDAVSASDPWLADHPPTVTWPGGHFAAGNLPPGDPFGDEVVAAVVAMRSVGRRRTGRP